MPEPPVDQSRLTERELVMSGYRFALSLTHHEHDAEDLVQQACLKIFRVQRRIKDKAYLIKTIRNLFYDAYRRSKAVKFDQLNDEGPTDSAPDQARVVDGRLDIAKLLGSLSSEEREVLYLNYVESFTAEEIGSITGKARGTVLSQLARAKEKVRRRQDAKSFSEEAV